VLLHAITDALLGAAGLADIGEQFPDTDPVNHNRDSCQLLRIAADLLASAGYSIGNLDCVVVAQQPKLAPYKMAMRQQIAELLGIDIAQVNIKGKTGEKVGPVGRLEAIEARCVALITR
jgi:2-C-methyl-D-erythritol 2,4-cyclodiphosphate synthase